MNGIERITQRLNADAQAEIDEILDAAKAEVKTIEENYASLARREMEEVYAKQEKTAKEQKERLIRAAQMEARKIILMAKQEMIERAYQKALERLCTLPEKEYTEVLAGLIQQAAPNNKGEVIFSEKDQKVGKKAVMIVNQRNNGSLTVSKMTRSMKGGCIVKNGKIEVNSMFETLVYLQKEETAGTVAEQLFG